MSGRAAKPIVLPYRFDTSRGVKLILRGVIMLLLVIVIGVLYSLTMSHDTVAAVQLLLIGLILTYFGRLFHQNLESSRGIIAADGISVEPGTLYGIRLHGPSGRFPLQQFNGVKVELVPPPVWNPGGPHERVRLSGKHGTPNILIASTADGVGRALGRQLASTLDLPYMEESAPY